MKKVFNILFLFIMTFSLITPFNINKANAIASSFTRAYINATELGPRTCPSTSCDRVKHDEGGTIWLYRPRVVEVIGYSGDWAQIKFNYYGFTYTGYILQKYLGNKQTYNIDMNYVQSLRNKGFPDSYAESLAKLHAVHPNWTFELSNTNVKFSDAVDGEYNPIYKNLISTTNKNQLSTDGAAYSNGTYIQFEPGWYAPSKDTLAYYMDPRNFLDDNSVFMFEQLSYNRNAHTKEATQKILNGTFMSSYTDYFMEAANTYNVSPIQLAARAIQEQGTNGSATSSMVSDGVTYYNYFNINASGSTTEQIVNNALSYAKSKGWNNPRAAILGGASVIANGYINRGQDTLFYQKFNVITESGKYYNQYMANIQAPYKESYSIFKSYTNSNLVDSNFTFKIPVYSDMINTSIATKSNNNNLSSLSINNYSIYPKFDSGITEYSCTIPNTINTLTVNASKADNKASISGTGNVNISNTNKIQVKVTAENGNVKTYNINLTKIEVGKETPNDIVSSMGYSNKNNNISGFTLGKDVNNIVSNIKTKYTTANVKVYNKSNQEITSGLVSTGQKIVISNNGNQTYTIVVYGDTNGDGKIGIGDYAKVSDTILGKTSMNTTDSLAADVNHDGKIGIADYAKIKDYILGIINRLD